VRWRSIGWVQESATAPGSDQLFAAAVSCLMATVVMQIAGQRHAESCFRISQYSLFQKCEVVLQFEVVDVAIDPVWFSSCEDDAVSRVDTLLGNFAKVIELRLIDVGLQL